MGNNRGKQASVRVVDEASMSAGERERIERKGQRVTRAVRLARSQLHAASAAKVARHPKLARWYCLQVQYAREFSVDKLLSDAGVETLLPVERVVEVKRGRKIDINRLFIPGYLLVRFVPSADAFDGLRRQKGVASFVGSASGDIHVVADKEIIRLRAVMHDGIKRVATDKTIKEGDKVMIVVGPFAGFECRVLAVKWSREARARVIIDVFGKLFEIESMPLAFVEKL